MGLAGPKNRTKLSQDPNNTQWSNSTDRFGHKILTGLGWTPGNTLGAKGAAHAENYTAASTSHIRVLLKDDNLGLGARRGREEEQFGLSIFQNLLGRLNGKTDVELEKEKEKRRDVELKIFQSRRFGAMNFVSGGFLVGDRIEKVSSVSGDVTSPVTSTGITTSSVVVKAEESRKVTKRKRGAEETEVANDSEEVQAEGKKKKKSKKRRNASEDNGEPTTTEVVLHSAQTAELANEKEQRRKARAARKAEKEAKRLRKEEKKKRKEAKKQQQQLNHQPQEREAQSLSDSNSGGEPASKAKEPTSTQSSITVSTTAPSALSNGRHIIRSRYIAQKRMAFSSEQALKEIFMIKAPG